MRVLFVSWDGPQVTYLEGLFVPIFERLKAHGYQFSVLQFTWGKELRAAQAACEKAEIEYKSITVARRPLAIGALVTAIQGAKAIKSLVSSDSVDIIMPRSTLPALASLLAFREGHIPMVFDADGLPLDERVEFAGASPKAATHRFLRDVESQAVLRASAVLTRTERAKEILLSRGGAGVHPKKFFVVTNGRHIDTFHCGTESERLVVREQLGLTRATPLIVYAGSIGAQYCIGEMLELFREILRLRSDAHALLLTRSVDEANKILAPHSDILKRVIVRSASADEVPRYLAAADLGIALRRQSFSMQGVAPIKIGEYLLCGLPVVATRGIGNTEVLQNGSAFLVEDFEEVFSKQCARWFVEEVLPNREALRDTCRAIGVQYFSIDACVASYLRAFEAVRHGT